jgi:radical SAM superfamily enzyme YgiQ (UPF0313 family)
MRILFVYPNLYTQMGFNHGLASLSAVLKRAGHETRLVNLNENLPPVPSDDEIVALVREWGPGVIGFSCLTMQYPEALRIARLLRAARARDGFVLPPLVVGGVHPTMVPEAVMADGAWDHVGVGECEDALLDLVARVERGERPSDVANFLSWKDGHRPEAADTGSPQADAAGAGGVADSAWVRNPVGEVPDFAAMPMPDYELFDTARITAQKHGWFGLMTSRGCPYRCTYCLNHKIVDRYRAELGRGTSQIGFFRFRTPAQMMEEIRWVIERYPDVGTFILDDDLFTLDAPHAIAFAEAYKAAGFTVPWVVNSHVNRLDPVMAKALAEGGCKILKLGIESGSERVRREILKRYMTDDDILATVRVGEEMGLHTSGFVMVGLPYETHAERWETVDLLAKSLIGRFRTSIFFPFPGTESHQLAIEGGFVDPARAGTLTDFTESSCLDFGESENLFVTKLATCMPWFVNVRAARHHDFPAAQRYAALVDEVLALDRAGWEAFEPKVRALDAELARAAAKAGELHYSIRFNAFMGVRSDFYLAEETGIEWLTAAAKPVPERLRALALAAAADEVC